MRTSHFKCRIGLCLSVAVALLTAGCGENEVVEPSPPSVPESSVASESVESSEAEKVGADHTESSVTNMNLLEKFSTPAQSNIEASTEIQRVQSPGGFEAWLVEEYSVPIIAVEIGFKGAARRDPAGKEGRATLMASMMNEGAGDLDSQAFLTRMEELAIRLGFSAGRDALYGSVRTLAEKRLEAFELLRLALTEPRFDEEPIGRMKQELLASLKRNETNPNRIASRTLFETVFAEHPYARNASGTPESLSALTAADLRAFHREVIAKDNMKIAVVGAISAEELSQLMDKTFAAIPANAEPESMNDASLSGQGQLTIVERTQPQSVAVFAGQGISRDDPDFFPAFVMNYILGGGGFSSRLTDEVREKRGLAYGIYTSYQDYDYGQVFFGSVATENGRIAETLDIVKKELEKLRDNGVTAEELANAKTYLTGSFPLRFDSNSKIANQLVSYQLTGRGIDYIDTRNDKVEAVTVEDIKRVAQRLIEPDHMTTVVVGQPEGLEADRTLKALGEPE